MKTIIIKTQAELDALPAKFDEWTTIEIRSTNWIIIRSHRENSSAVLWGNSSAVLRENSRAVLWENSRAVLWGNSRAELWENSRAVLRENSSAVLRENSLAVLRENSLAVLWENSSAEAYQFAVVLAFSFLALRLFDWSAVRVKKKGLKYEISGEHVTEINDFEAVEIPFDTWLERGYVVADGITSKLVEHTKDGDIDVFKVKDFRDIESFVVRKGDKSAHGDTLLEAKADLDYKLNGADTTRFKTWKRDEMKPVGEMIVAYRSITGACAKGVRDFIKGVPSLPPEVSPAMVISLIGDSYGANQFKEFFQ